jgi:hypothetical protein
VRVLNLNLKLSAKEKIISVVQTLGKGKLIDHPYEANYRKKIGIG